MNTPVLELDKETPPFEVYKKIVEHSIAKAEIMSLYGK